MPASTWAPSDGAVPLTHLGVIRARGEAAADFLHAQLTQDIVHLPPGSATFAAYLSPKGRVLASFIVLREAPDALLLICHRSVLTATLQRLSMFVLRSRVVLSDATHDCQLVGLLGASAHALLPTGGAPWECRSAGRASVIRLHPADGQPRALWAAPVDEPMPAATRADEATWLHAEVRSGVVTVSQPSTDAFVPQMLNYESVGGVNFHKGCYPGQEIVARSQFRGTIKRRTFLAHAQTSLRVGDEVYGADADEQAVGSIVQAAAAPDGGSSALVVLQLGATQERLHAGSPSGVPLLLDALPYALLQDL